jgi:hypothetical protein
MQDSALQRPGAVINSLEVAALGEMRLRKDFANGQVA